MRRCFIILNHNLRAEQISELNSKWEVDVIIEMPTDLKALFSDLPTSEANVASIAKPFTVWLKQENIRPKDIALVQGEPGVTFFLVHWLISQNIQVLHATTPRIVKEKHDTKTSKFLHRHFRKYQLSTTV